MCALSHFSCVWLLVTPWTVALQAPQSIGFSRREHRSGLPCPPPGDLPDPGIEPASPALQAGSLPLNHQDTHKYEYFFPFGLASHFFRSPQSAESRVLCSGFSSVVYFIRIPIVYMCQSQPPYSFQSPLFSLSIHVCSLHLCLYFCFASKIIYSIFLDSTGIDIQYLFSPFWLPSLCLTVSVVT